MWWLFFLTGKVCWKDWCGTETPIIWPSDAKSQLIWKDPDSGKDWGQEEKGTTEDEMIGWHQRTWIWVGSGSWWWTGRPGMVWSMWSQRVGHHWAAELNWRIERMQSLRVGNNRHSKQSGHILHFPWIPEPFLIETGKKVFVKVKCTFVHLEILSSFFNF